MESQNSFAPQTTTGLQVRILPGTVYSASGLFVSPITTVTLQPTSTNYIYLDLSTLTFVVNQTGFPATQCFPVAIVKTAVVEVTSFTDVRPDFIAGVSQTIASGTAALRTAQINSGAAATTVTVSAPGTLATDNILADFNADPTGVTGYAPSVNGMLTIIKFPTTGNVNFIVVNNTAAQITPGAITLNWRVVR